MLEIFVVIKDDVSLYYLLKVIRDGFDIYVIPPHLGIHYTLHESGKSHFRYEGEAVKTRNELPLALMGGAGEYTAKGFTCMSLRELGSAVNISNAIFSINSLSDDFRKFNRSLEKCFVIDKGLFPENNEGVMVGVWAVPERNKVSFEFNNPDISEKLLYKGRLYT